jgi:polyisoprenoid-binding protein YceI
VKTFFTSLRKQVIAVIFSSALIAMQGAYALAPAWKIVPAESNLTFTATQNGAPVTGSFKKFSGDINFDPAKLSESKIKIVVDMNSIATSYDDLTLTLKTPEWFDMKIFPEAVFEASQFEQAGPNQYVAKGTLTIRDKSQPVILMFAANQPSDKNATAKGSIVIKRTAFGVGQGEWASTSEVKDDVTVNFTVGATK